MSMSTRVPIGFLVKDSYVELRGYIGDRGGIESKPDVNKEREDSKIFVFAPIFYVHIDKLTNVGGFNPSRDGKRGVVRPISSIRRVQFRNFVPCEAHCLFSFLNQSSPPVDSYSTGKIKFGLFCRRNTNELLLF